VGRSDVGRDDVRLLLEDSGAGCGFGYTAALASTKYEV
jgi:hypothetical protein